MLIQEVINMCLEGLAVLTVGVEIVRVGEASQLEVDMPVHTLALLARKTEGEM